MTDISVTVDGRATLTGAQVAARAGTLKDAESARVVLARLGVKPAAHVGAVYFEDEAIPALAARPGRTGRPRKGAAAEPGE
jgi:hypothetical protein